jgi:hypothetical protein
LTGARTRTSTESTADLLLGLARRLEPAAKLATAVSAVAGIGLIYILGGIAMALRLEGSRFPIEEGLKVVPRETLLLLGFRELLLVLVGIFVILRLRSYLHWIAGVLVLLVPLTVEGLVWPLGLLVVYAIWRYSRENAFERAAVATALFTVVAVPLRFSDPPYRFPAAVVVTPTACRQLELALAEKPQPGEDLSCRGGLISSTSSGVYLGAPPGAVDGSKSRIVFIPHSDITDFVLESHFPVAPRTSILGRFADAAGLPRFSCNPLECWVREENYGARFLG